MSQPDFTRLFYEHFGGEPSIVTYELRKGPNLLHDKTFINSLLHDARFLWGSITEDEGEIIIPVNRDCWEIPMTENNELHTADAEIRINGVIESKWVGAVPEKVDPWMDYLWLSENYRSHSSETFEITFVGEEWRYEVTLMADDWTFVLQDSELPHLFEKYNDI